MFCNSSHSDDIEKKKIAGWKFSAVCSPFSGLVSRENWKCFPLASTTRKRGFSLPARLFLMLQLMDFFSNFHSLQPLHSNVDKLFHFLETFPSKLRPRFVDFSMQRESCCFRCFLSVVKALAVIVISFFSHSQNVYFSIFSLFSSQSCNFIASHFHNSFPFSISRALICRTRRNYFVDFEAVCKFVAKVV